MKRAIVVFALVLLAITRIDASDPRHSYHQQQMEQPTQEQREISRLKLRVVRLEKRLAHIDSVLAQRPK